MRFLKATPSILFGATVVSLILLPSPEYIAQKQAAQAHQVEIVEDVGATLHIEPNDTPRAGEEVLAWFALTRKGGKTIPLAACDCQLAVYAQPKGDAASLTPTLSAVDAEGYEDIPGARFTFPAVGAYTLVINGSPKQADDFTPFELDFDVTVAAGQSTQSAPAERTETVQEKPTDSTVSSLSVDSPEPKEANQRFPTIVLPALLGISVVVLIGAAIFQKKNKQKS